MQPQPNEYSFVKQFFETQGHFQRIQDRLSGKTCNARLVMVMELMKSSILHFMRFEKLFSAMNPRFSLYCKAIARDDLLLLRDLFHAGQSRLPDLDLENSNFKEVKGKFEDFLEDADFLVPEDIIRRCISFKKNSRRTAEIFEILNKDPELGKVLFRVVPKANFHIHLLEGLLPQSGALQKQVRPEAVTQHAKAA